MKPGITLIASAKKSYLWEKFIDSIGENKIHWQVIFVGPIINIPVNPLPKLRCFFSEESPVECVQIAANLCNTEFIFHTADDLTFVGPNPLDRLMECFKANDSQYLGVSCRYMLNGVDHSHYCHRFDVKDDKSPYIMGAGTLMRKSTWEDLGGLDSRFIATMYDVDLFMRMYEAGGRIVLSDVYIDEYKAKGEPTFPSEVWQHDRELVDSLWLHNGKAKAIRKGV